MTVPAKKNPKSQLIPPIKLKGSIKLEGSSGLDAEISKEEVFALNVVYDFGNSIEKEEKSESKFALKLYQQSKGPSALQRGKLKALLDILWEDILGRELEFTPLFIDFVTYDPNDEAGDLFHVTMCSTEKEVIM